MGWVGRGSLTEVQNLIPSKQHVIPESPRQFGCRFRKGF